MASALLLGALALLVLYLAKVNYSFTVQPEVVRKLAIPRWTPEECRAAYEEELKNPTDVMARVPKKLGRRYIVVGGSGFIGSWIIMQLLARGESPSAIRILDIAHPVHPDLRSRTDLDIVHCDITDPASVRAAYTKPWPSAAVSALPLTVFHCAALISIGDRHPSTYAPYTRINVDGLAHSLAAAREAGASVFAATSSGSIAIRALQIWAPPWRLHGRNIAQFSDNADVPADQPESRFAAAYCLSKHRGERLVLAADSAAGGLRTGAIRPSHVVYGHGTTNQSSMSMNCLILRKGPTWLRPVVQSFVSAENAALAHLCLEAALLSHPDATGGRAFAASDPSPPTRFADFYDALAATSEAPVSFVSVPALPLVLLSYAVEAYALLRVRFPGLPRLSGDVAALQPAMLAMSSASFVVSDERARRKPGEGGIGYDPAVTTLKGLVRCTAAWNAMVRERGGRVEEIRHGRGVYGVEVDELRAEEWRRKNDGGKVKGVVEAVLDVGIAAPRVKA